MQEDNPKTKADFESAKAKYDYRTKLFFWAVLVFHVFVFCLFVYIDIDNKFSGDFFPRSGALNTAALLFVDFFLLRFNEKAKTEALTGGYWGGKIAVDVIFKFTESVKLQSAVFISVNTLVWGFGDKLF
ncbi:hypothetical protein [Pseudoalteromonas ruthenica]|uniref:hypothetical protein n=1 Tax=Pseudoalteromonas ruthenica TaxID=151081 RepID=UPI00110AD1D2|nr:hypothetical protein [Pseudoalteromonas ruthenica]TMO87686.1 hypothetical protein CWC12_10430 [Pseudoalteromonas ruthenica]TMP20857.1 hypothetical protein CWC06_19550 [Pseudoalteromonas ruthenica]